MYPLSHMTHSVGCGAVISLDAQVTNRDTKLRWQKTWQRSCQPRLWGSISHHKINSKARCSSIPVLRSFSQLDFTRELSWHNECTHLNSNFYFSICPLCACTWRWKQNIAHGELLTWGKGQSFPLELKKATLSHPANLRHNQVLDHLDTRMVLESYC